MTEKEMFEKIKDAAMEEPIPESIKPEAMKERLKKQSENQRMAERKVRRSRGFLYGSRIAAAAVVLLVCSAAGVQRWNMYRDSAESSMAETVASDSALTSGAESSMEDGADATEVAAAKQDIEDIYMVAENYDEIYDLLKKQEKLRNTEDLIYDFDTTTAGSADEDDTTYFYEEGESSGEDMSSEGIADNIKYSQKDFAIESADSESVSGEENYSKTNLQTEGVDESDIIKTDGSYIYTVSGNRVIITDIRDGALEVAGEIPLSLESTSDSIIEMYVDNGILNLIVQKESTGLEKQSGKEVNDVYYLSSDMETEILTYDIRNPQKPKLSGCMTQDGYYHTSRKIGDMIYLFTDKSLGVPGLSKKQAVTEENLSGWIPLVNEKPVSADCIYLSEEGSEGLVISAMNVNKPDEIVDNTVILNEYVEIYVSTRAVYLYQEKYTKGKSITQIAKFSLEDGKINAVDAVSVNGEIRDTFAINEYQGKLRVLTTDSNFFGEESTNQLYLFNENLELTGKIEDIATGEEIYAARYFGDMAYFVTYRNTDPLFAVDLSDDTNPKIVGELKITGFSEYLHFWGEDKLVGIGYETDPDSGVHEGLKITMFDISNPAKLKEIKTLVLKNVDYSQALYDYKCVLADANENLLGFTTEDYENNHLNYLLFSWEDGKFVNLMSEKIAENFSSDNYRGIYVGDVFYVAGRDSICSFDRTKNYQLMKKIEFH